jgi:hypothetical protein
MLTAPAASVEFTKRKLNAKSLPALVATNSSATLFYRADYELFWLRKSRREVTRLGRLIKHCRTFAGVAALSKELREWCERERVLLRIKLPGTETSVPAKAGRTIEVPQVQMAVEPAEPAAAGEQAAAPIPPNPA